MGLMGVLLSKANDVLWCHLQVGFMQPEREIHEFVATVCIKLIVVNLILDIV